MNRFFLITSAAAVPLMADASLKSAVLLVLAAVCVLLMRRASAAARHAVWLAAVLALLLVPVLSAVLPGWRVLPQWATVETASGKNPNEGNKEGALATAPALKNAPLPRLPALPLPEAPVSDSLPASQPPQLSPAPPAASALAPQVSSPASPPFTAWLFPAWAVGCALILLRLAAAHWVLRRAMRRSHAATGVLAEAFDAAVKVTGLRRPVRLLVDHRRTVPVVWGVFRPRLLVPAEAQSWDAPQLRSVLMHELAHLRRHDPLVQTLAQMVCALHWFNPLVWLAAWRLHVERERACDDLVLASGVRPSEYAGHLLHVATRLSPARWTAACGLAMARKSSLEGRLLAVLSEKLNRRGLTRALTITAIVLGAAIAVPVAMLRAQAEKTAEKAARVAADMKPKHETAQALFKQWQASARTDGKIPGAFIGHIAREMDYLFKNHPDETPAALKTLRPRADASHDWIQSDAITLLDGITAISTAPVRRALMPAEFEDDLRNLKAGLPLPVELTSAAWGPPAPNGLRTAWLLEPRGEEYALGSTLKARVLFHNTGRETVIFKSPMWHELGLRSAHDAGGAEIPVSPGPHASMSGLTPMVSYRLAPGEYCEVMGDGVSIGKADDGFVWSEIGAKEGDTVTMSDTVDLTYGWAFPDGRKDSAGYWKMLVADRVALEAPMPPSAADREQLIRRVTRDLFGEAATAAEIAEFIADNTPDALTKLTARLQTRPGITSFSGKLTAGELHFRVIAADPGTAKKPRLASEPNSYVLGDGVNLLVTGKRKIATGITYHYELHADGVRLNVSQANAETPDTNKAYIVFVSPAVTTPRPPYEIALPDGMFTYAMAWERGAGVLWITQKGLVRSYDFTNPAQVQETRYEPGSIVNIPAPFRDALKGALEGKSTAQTTPSKGEKLPPEVEQKLKWGESVNGLRAALIILPSAGEPKGKDTPDLYLVVQNVSEAPVHFNDTIAAQGLRYASIHRDELLQSRTRIDEPTMTDVTLQPREAISLVMIPHAGSEKHVELAGARGETRSKGQLLAAGMLKEPHMILTGQLNIEKAPAGAWTGKLVTPLTGGADAQVNEPPGQIGAASPMEKLKWGEPANGLRTAVAFFSTSQTKPKPDDLLELFLAIQNVSKAPIRLTDASLGPKDPSRSLYVKLDGEIMMGLGSNNPPLGDLTLQPGEITTLRMFTPEPQKPGGHTIGQLMTDGAFKDTHQTFMIELKIEKAPAGAWTGKVRTADASAYEATSQPQPKDKKAQALFNMWQHHTRQSGEFPGGLIARLAEKVNEFIRNNTGDASGDPYAKKMAPIVPRLDSSRDWKAFEVVALMDDIAAVTSIPLETTLDKTTQNAFTPGSPLPAEWADAPWGEAQPNGLRMACLLEPRAAEHRLGTPLKARLLFHNSGKDNVVFRTQSWHQPDHKATDAGGAEIKVDSIFWTTIGRPVTFRLAPGEFAEVITPGIGVGPVGKHEDWQYTRIRVGSWVEAKAGDEVTITTIPFPIGFTDQDPQEVRSLDASAWWTGFIKYHLTQDLPIPADPAERKHLVYRAGMELFGTPLSTKEIDSFVNDRSPNAIDNLAKLLAQRTDTRPAAGTLVSGPTKFRVLPADPDAAKKPRTVSGAGQHLIGGHTTFAVTTRLDGDRIVHDGHLSYSPPDETAPAPHYKIELPDGYNSWAAGWIRDTTEMWITQKGLLRKYDFSNFSKVQETRYEGDKIDSAPIPPAMREALRAGLDVPEAPKPKRAAGPPASEAR
ncbi:MAG TPA: M56 family metallopeptidase [Verrucomicrobiales bacterium]|nr:M56 family metallopeptidase [Verrucomicrobiales bacterium]